MTVSLSALNAASPTEFAALIGAVFEHAPWIAEGAAHGRPYATVSDLFAALRATLEGADEARRRALLAEHPEPAGFEAQGTVYREKFGLPFILCAERHGRASRLSTFERRLASTPEIECQVAEAEILRLAALRLAALVSGDGPPKTTGRVSTHVLDTCLGRPAAGVALELFEIVSATDAVLVARAETNADGRTDAPLIHGRPVPMAAYELRVGLGAYHRRLGLDLPDPPFLDIVPLRFGVADPEGHYHVPLAATPWSYQTYRGS